MDHEPDRLLELGRLAELGLLSAELVHELRQPIFAVRAMGQLLERRLVDDEQRAQLQAMLDQLSHAALLLDRHAASSRRPGPVLQLLPLAPPVEAGVALLRHRARQVRKQLHVQVGANSRSISGDPVAIQQITANLVANALDAARRRVDVRVDGDLLRVEDDGPGIPEEHRDRIFEPFFSTKAPGAGTGLGLAITHHLVQASGGHLACASSSAGTVFSVRFPLDPAGGPVALRPAG